MRGRDFTTDPPPARRQRRRERHHDTLRRYRLVTVHTVGLKVDGQTGESGIVVIEFDRTFLAYKRDHAPFAKANY